jgi:hypothetical protein
MRAFLNSSMFQSVAAALGRGLVMAALAYFAFLVKHVHDYETIIGTCGAILLMPLAGLLHLVVPAIPGLPVMAARWPRMGEPTLPPDAPRPGSPLGSKSSDHARH